MSCSTMHCILQNILVKIINTVTTIYNQYDEVNGNRARLLQSYNLFTGKNIT